jgi:hypothetical protein
LSQLASIAFAYGDDDWRACAAGTSRQITTAETPMMRLQRIMRQKNPPHPP